MDKPTFMSRDKIKQELERMHYDPYSLDNLHVEAERYVKVRDYESALDTINQIIELYGSTSQIYTNRALCLYRLQDYEQAVISLDESLKLDPDNQDSLKLKSSLEHKIERLRKYVMVIYQ